MAAAAIACNVPGTAAAAAANRAAGAQRQVQTEAKIQLRLQCKNSATPGADRGPDPASLKASSLAGEHEVLHAKLVRLHALRKLARTYCLTYLRHVTMHCLCCPCQSMHTMLRPQYLLTGRL
jgi:hypothetical protein